MSKRTNEAWLNDLTTTAPRREAAIADLRQILVSGLHRGLVGQINTSAPEFDALAEDFVQEALLKILDNLHTFAGLSLFTTWAHKIAVSVALTELRRKRWQDSSLDSIVNNDQGEYTPQLVADPAPAPENALARREMVERVQHLIAEELTDKQRQALVSAVIEEQSPAVVAKQMNMNPNAFYKLLHDARVRLKNRLLDEGLTPGEILSIFG